MVGRLDEAMKGNVVFFPFEDVVKEKKPEDEQIIGLRAGPEISIYQYGSPERVLAAASEVVVVSTTMEEGRQQQLLLLDALIGETMNRYLWWMKKQ